MNKKMFKSIVIISLTGVLIWLAGFILILVLNFENFTAVNRGWFIIMFAATLIFSAVKNMKK
ncbi:MAG: hypothetical protein Q4F95_06220 [Oscillospiraceae bacterium]|nr:hypothetical protein [Oscillospiraceae bacterium]